MKKLFLLLPFLCCYFSTFAQTSLAGKVTDEDTGEELIGANVAVFQKRNFVTGTSTDFDGNYKVTLDPGIYEIAVSYLGFPTKKVKEVLIKKEQNNKLDIALGGLLNPVTTCCVTIFRKVPLLQIDETASGITISDIKIYPMPTKNINEIIGTTPGVTFPW